MEGCVSGCVSDWEPHYSLRQLSGIARMMDESGWVNVMKREMQCIPNNEASESGVEVRLSSDGNDGI